MGGSLPGPVYDADLTEDGYLCYVSAGSAVKSELQLLDREQRSVLPSMAQPGISPAALPLPAEALCALYP